MKTNDTQIKLIKWYSAEDMHQASKNWLSELNFIKDEQLFFENLIRKYIFQLIAPNQFKESGKIVQLLSDSKKQTDDLIKIIRIHENQLKIMVDGVDEFIKEEVYKAEHRRLINDVNDFLLTYKKLKQTLFTTIKEIVKTENKNLS